MVAPKGIETLHHGVLSNAIISNNAGKAGMAHVCRSVCMRKPFAVHLSHSCEGH